MRSRNEGDEIGDHANTSRPKREANAHLRHHPGHQTGNHKVLYLDADMNEPDTVLQGAVEVLDLTRPVAVLFLGVLGHVADQEQAQGLVQALLAALPSGSYLVISDGVPTEQASAAHDDYADSGAVPYHLRPPEQLRSFFDGLEFVEPGFGPVPLWRPNLDTQDNASSSGTVDPGPDAPWGGVARKP